MKQPLYLVAVFLLTVISIVTGQALKFKSDPYPGTEETSGISPLEYQLRRRAVIARMDSGSIAVFCAGNMVNRNGDVDYRFRQNDNVLYLTGCHERQCVLILSPDALQVDSVTVAQEIFFIQKSYPSWNGPRLGLKGAQRVLGFGERDRGSAVCSLEKLKELLPSILQSKKVLYYTPSLPEFLFDPVSGYKFVAVREMKNELAKKYPHLTVRNPGLLLNDLRAVKSSAELILLQKAVDATVKGCIEAAKCCTPGMMEYELQAVIEYWFARMGCEFYGFPSIVGSGPNALNIHDDANRRKMNSGELAVIDIGAEVQGYSADLTRTIPVNGSYSEPQREIYDLVLKAHDAAIKEIRPDIPVNVPWKKGLEILGEGLVKLGIIKEQEELNNYCPHGIGHFIGLDVHDVAPMGPLAPGMVLTIEPGLYIPDSSTCDKKYRGIGIRIEDDVLVTKTGYRVLTASAPVTADEMELLMKQGNDLRKFKNNRQR